MPTSVQFQPSCYRPLFQSELEARVGLMRGLQGESMEEAKSCWELHKSKLYLLLLSIFLITILAVILYISLGGLNQT